MKRVIPRRREEDKGYIIPVQEVQFPENPVLQEQVKEPGVLTQVDPTWAQLFPVL